MNSQLNEIIANDQQSNVVSMISGENGYAKNAKISAVNGRNVTLIFKLGRSDQAGVEGRVAFSCLVSPLVNDTVACIQNDSGVHIVLAILDRPDDSTGSQDMTLSFPANVNLQSRSGDVSICAADNVSILAGDSLTCASKKTIHKSHEALIKYQNTTAKGVSIVAQYKTMHLLGDMINTIAKNAFSKFNNYVRRSSVSDYVSAAHMDRKVDGVLSVNTKTTLLISKKDTKIDGERIHMG